LKTGLVGRTFKSESKSESLEPKPKSKSKSSKNGLESKSGLENYITNPRDVMHSAVKNEAVSNPLPKTSN